MQHKPKVAVIMGSDSDFPVMEKCLDVLRDFGIEVKVQVCSAHRTPDKAAKFARGAEDEGFGVIIAAAGKAAHLPGVIAAFTCLPVIGVPIKSSTLDGLDSLLSIVQMPSGIPVATVAINGSQNAALLAVQVLSLKYDVLRTKMKDFKVKMAEEVDVKNEKLQSRIAGQFL